MNNDDARPNPYGSNPRSFDPLPANATESELRERAISRLRARRGFWWSAIWFVAINAMLIFFWSRSGGFFWPIFPIVAWGIGLGAQAIALFGAGESEAKIQEEMRRLSGR